MTSRDLAHEIVSEYAGMTFSDTNEPLRWLEARIATALEQSVTKRNRLEELVREASVWLKSFHDYREGERAGDCGLCGVIDRAEEILGEVPRKEKA